MIQHFFDTPIVVLSLSVFDVCFVNVCKVKSHVAYVPNVEIVFKNDKKI